MRFLLSVFVLGTLVFSANLGLAAADDIPPSPGSPAVAEQQKVDNLNYTRRLAFAGVAWHNRATHEVTGIAQDRLGSAAVATVLLATSAVALLTPVGSWALYWLPLGSTSLGSLGYGLTLCNATSFACDRAAEENGLKCTTMNLVNEITQMPGKLRRSYQRWCNNVKKA